MIELRADTAETPCFRVGDVRVEPGLNRLSSELGQTTLEPRVMELLLHLAQHAGETISKEQLLAEVWGGAFVVDGVVAKTVSALRQALGDDAGQPRYILTVPRRGYRLIAGVEWAALGAAAAERVAPVLAPAPRRPRRMVWAIGGLLLAALLGLGVPALRPKADQEARGARARGGAAQLPPELERRLLEARLLWSRRGFTDLDRAHELFSQVVAAAPESGEAHAWRALSLVTRANYWRAARVETLTEAEVEVGRALALAPDHAVTQAAAGVVAFNRHFAVDRAINHYRRALELAPELAIAHQFLAEALSAAGRHEEAVTAARRAVELEPTSALMHGVAGLVLQAARRPAEALAALDQALVLEPQFRWLQRYRSYALIRLGREEEAAKAWIADAAGDDTEAGGKLAELAARAGFAGLWQHRLALLEAARQRGQRVLRIQLAETLAALGQRAEALAELESGDIGDESEYFIHYRASPAFDALRDDPRFRAVYARYGL